MKTFFIILAIDIAIFLVRCGLTFFVSLIANWQKENKKSYSAFISVVICHIAEYVFLLSYSFLIPSILYIIGTYKAFAWVSSICIIISLVYASLNCLGLAVDYRLQYKYNVGFCFACMFVINWLNITFSPALIKAFLYTFADISMESLGFDILSTIIFVFDIILLIIMVNKSKLKKADYALGINYSASQGNTSYSDLESDELSKQDDLTEFLKICDFYITKYEEKCLEECPSLKKELLQYIENYYYEILDVEGNLSSSVDIDNLANKMLANAAFALLTSGIYPIRKERNDINSPSDRRYYMADKLFFIHEQALYFLMDDGSITVDECIEQQNHLMDCVCDNL